MKNVLKIFTILMLIVLILSGCKSNKIQNGNENNIINESKKITSEEERNEPIGGTIEVFKSEEDMLKRKKYLEEITSSMSAFAEYSYSQGVYLLRLSKELTPTQAKEYESVFYEITK